MDNKYLYELHCHTSEVSKCGKVCGKEVADFYYKKGFTGICITDHFFNGNCAVPKELSWSEKVDFLLSGYEEAKTEGDKIGLDVFFGFEYSHSGTDFLVYGINGDWLKAHPECMELRTPEFCNLVRNDGAFVAQAHPYREASYIEMIRLLPRNIDATEVYNACRTDFENEMAELYAEKYNLLRIAGSDNHSCDLPKLGAMEFDRKMLSLNDLFNEIKNGKGKPLMV